MKHFTIAIALILALVFAPAHAQVGSAKSTGDLVAECNTLLASGQPGGMTAAAVRQCVLDIIASALNKVDTPGLLGPWTGFTPVVTCASGTITTLGAVSGLYTTFGKTTLLHLDITITTNGSCAGNINATIPVAAIVNTTCVGRATNVSGKELQAIVGGFAMFIISYDNTYPASSGERLWIDCVIPNNL